jgi:hypothetical protein
LLNSSSGTFAAALWSWLVSASLMADAPYPELGISHTHPTVKIFSQTLTYVAAYIILRQFAVYRDLFYLTGDARNRANRKFYT